MMVCLQFLFLIPFVYEMLGIPVELYTAMFDVARIVGWSAHRIEEMICADKIIRPAYESIVTLKPYKTLQDRSTPKLDEHEKEVFQLPLHDASC